MNDAERFEQIFLSQVTRPGADKLLEWLKSTDFFTAPASTRFHGAYPGGLVKHSLNVYYALLGNFNLRGLYSPQTQTIVALLHDVCKANYYAGEYPDYTVKDQIPMGHGEKSVYLVMKHMELTDDEALAIRWHMAHGDGAGPQLRQALPGKHLVHQSHIPVGGKHAIVIDNNSGALLSPVLQGVQRVIGIGRHIGGLRRSNAEHAAFFMDMALPAPALSPRHGSAAAS